MHLLGIFLFLRKPQCKASLLSASMLPVNKSGHGFYLFFSPFMSRIGRSASSNENVTYFSKVGDISEFLRNFVMCFPQHYSVFMRRTACGLPASSIWFIHLTSI